MTRKVTVAHGFVPSSTTGVPAFGIVSNEDSVQIIVPPGCPDEMSDAILEGLGTKLLGLVVPDHIVSAYVFSTLQELVHEGTLRWNSFTESWVWLSHGPDYRKHSRMKEVLE